MWGYYDAYTAAQIELMAIDCPMVVYKDNDKKKKKNNSEPQEADALSVIEAVEKWERKYNNDDNKGISISLEGLKQFKK